MPQYPAGPPAPFRMKDRRKAPPTDDHNPLPQPRQPRHSSNSKPLLKQTTPLESRLRQTSLFPDSYHRQLTSAKAPKTRVTSNPESPSRRTKHMAAVPGRSSSRMRPSLAGRQPSYSIQHQRNQGENHTNPQPLPGPSRVAVAKRKARHSEPFPRQVASPEPEQPPFSLYEPLVSPAKQGTGSQLFDAESRNHGLSSIEAIDTIEIPLPTSRLTHQALSSDTIELPPQSSPPGLSPPLSPQVQQQTLYSLGIDLNTQCSPLTYQVLHPKHKIHSVNRAHGGWVEAKVDANQSDPQSVEDDLYKTKSTPAPRVSRHRALSSIDTRDKPPAPRRSISPQQPTIALLSAHRLVNGHPVVDLDRDLYAETSGHEAQLDKSREYSMCRRSSSPARAQSNQGSEPINKSSQNIFNDLDEHAFGHKTASAELPPLPLLTPAKRNEGGSQSDEYCIVPAQHDDNRHFFHVPESESLTESFIPASHPRDDGKQVFLFPDSMAQGRLDWEAEGNLCSSPTPDARRGDPEDPMNDQGDMAPQTLGSTPIATRDQLTSRRLSSSPSCSASRVLVEETQPDYLSPSPKRPRILAEETQPIPHSKSISRSLAPPTPISARTQHLRRMKNLRESSGFSSPVASGLEPVSPHKPRVASSLKKIANAGYAPLDHQQCFGKAGLETRIDSGIEMLTDHGKSEISRLGRQIQQLRLSILLHLANQT